MKKNLGGNSVLFLFFLSSIVVLIIAISAGNTMLASSRMIEESSKNRMLALSEAAALLTNADELDLFMTVEDMERPEYRKLKDRLDSFTRGAGITFTYYMRIDTKAGTMQYVVDNVQDPAEIDDLSTPPIPGEAGALAALSGMAHAVDLGSYDGGWDGLLTAWAPVYYRDGSRSNLVVGVDAQDVHIKAARDNTRFLAVVLLASLVIVLASCLLSLFLYRRKAEQSEAASAAKSSFLSRMSHEMRTPLNAIMGLCGMSMESEDMETVKGYIGNIDISSRHLKRVIDDVLDISKIESGKMSLELTPVTLTDELNDFAEIVGLQMELKGQNFTMRIDEDIPPEVYYDTIHMRQILMNLLSNAMKFTQTGGRITLTVELLGTADGRCNLEWSISDNGIGIDKDDRERLFAPFEQGDASTTRPYGGSGLGLAISKQLIEMMDGRIRVESELGEGSTFLFNTWLKIASPGETEKARNARTSGELNLSGKRILLVEDSEINQMIAANLLEKHGATVETANDGREGFQKFTNNPGRYDLVFMDIQMPVMDGYEATKSIRESGAPRADSIPIVAMTANVFKEDVDRAFRSGMNGHVGKPLDLEQIKTVVNEIFGSPGASQSPPL